MSTKASRGITFAIATTITIPMVGTVRSLNVSVATGIALFEVVKQRNPVKE